MQKGLQEEVSGEKGYEFGSDSQEYQQVGDQYGIEEPENNEQQEGEVEGEEQENQEGEENGEDENQEGEEEGEGEEAEGDEEHKEGDGDERVPLLFVDVNLGAGKAERIVVYEGDKSEDLARQFAIDHGLDMSMTGKLKELLDSQIAGLLSKIDEEEGADDVEEGEEGEEYEEGEEGEEGEEYEEGEEGEEGQEGEEDEN
mmetsp:Transcript_30767/g.27988  ORF Transcript_30767/g.27988 Transcript_30767/m.27988 type:complete len:200 (+) Transcript_30767:208-807(+)